LDAVSVQLVESVDEVLKIALAPPETPQAEVAEPPAQSLDEAPGGMTH